MKSSLYRDWKKITIVNSFLAFMRKLEVRILELSPIHNQTYICIKGYFYNFNCFSKIEFIIGYVNIIVWFIIVIDFQINQCKFSIN